MILFELVIALLFAGAVFALLADKIGVPYPALLAVVGVVLALIPGTPEILLDPELALALFVAPTLLDTAYDASPRDLKKNLIPVASLAVVLVLVTVVAVAWAARLVVPGMGWAPALALGAIVAPPDASAATAVLRKLRPPHRLMVILEGESLFNDATSLLIYRLAVGAAVTGAFSGWSVAPALLLSCGGGILAGWALARIQIWIGSRIKDISTNVLLQFVGVFAVWIFAERIGLSAILTVVSFAMVLSRRVGGVVSARRRIASYAVWDVAVLVLNVLAFVLIGLQLRGITSRLQDGEWGMYLACAGAVCAVAVAVRVAWTLPTTALLKWTHRRYGSGDPHTSPRLANAAMASWCGMRGIVTLAAALALPDGPHGFPHRDVIVFSAFCVVLFTLVVQGATLRPLMRRLRLKDDGSVEKEAEVARAETARAALRALDGMPTSPSVDILRGEYQARLDEGAAGETPEEGEADLGSVQKRAVKAQRDALRDLRARDVIGDDAFHVVEEEIDLLELAAETRVRPPSGTARP